MQFFSTRNRNHIVSLKEAVVKGLADDGGLYLPTEIPVLSKDFIQNLYQLSAHEIYFEIAKKFVGKDIDEDDLLKIIKSVYNFDTPVVNIHDSIYALELYHGPTMAFKDVGARFMSRLLSYFYQNENQTLNVVVATSGDTGSAVAAGFYEVPGINVFILYPKGKVSVLQEKQLTTWGKNITAIEVEGTFDDCQKIVKQLLSDADLQKTHTLTSANSINIARLIPQSFYYFSSFADLQSFGNQIVYSIPSGNYGNLTGGVLAQKMGLPIHQFIAASNINDVVPNYLVSGIYKPKPSIQTISNAMDVGAPSNFERLQNLFTDVESFRKSMAGYSFTDTQTKDILKLVYKEHDYLMDPHGAVAYLGLQEYMKNHKVDIGVFLETAHPAKFKDTVDAILGEKIEIPEKLENFAKKEKNAILVQNKYENVLEIIKNKS